MPPSFLGGFLSSLGAWGNFMNPQPPPPLDPVTRQPHRIPWGRWAMYAGGVLVVLGAAVALAIRSYMTISVAPDTTVLTAPLLADGYPDYIGYLDAANATGVKPEENAWISLLRCCGPDEIDKAVRAEHYRKLGIEPLPEGVLYFQAFYDTEGIKLVPESVLIASSAAAQLPWHTRFVRLAAINAYREANGPVFDPLADPAEPEPEMLPYDTLIASAAQVAAQAAWDFAEDPDAASVQYAFEANDSANDYFDNDDEAKIQDLRPEALAKIKPAFDTPAEEAAWRSELFENTRYRLIEREEVIMSGQPWTRDECPLGAHWVETYSPYLDQLQQELRQRKKLYVPFLPSPREPNLFGALALPSLQLQRNLARSYAYRANLYLSEQNIPAALDDLVSIQHLGALLPQHPFLVEGLLGIAVQGIGDAQLAALIHSQVLSDEQLAELEARLRPIVPQFDIVDCFDHGERLFSVGSLVEMVTRGARNYFQSGKDKVDPHWEQKIVHWDSVLREMNERYDRYRDAAKTQDFQVIQQKHQFYSTLPANRQELKAYYESPPWYLLPSTKTEVMKYQWTETFVSSFSDYCSAFLKARVRHDLLRVMLALERYRRAHMSYPAALTELVPTYLPAVPIDPFDGLPIKYRRTPAGGYRAYSVWQNAIDDGGTPNVDQNGEVEDFFGNDLVIGSPDEIPRAQNLAW